ncbi:MAG: hypothetical protein ACLSDQ_12555 [Adlercreutzia equolifaciens]
MELKARVDREEALAFLGHRGQKLGDLRERLERAACLCEKELVPRGVYREMDASEAFALLPGRDIARHVEGCARVVLLAVTLGTQSEMLLRRERALSATDGLLADACASSLVEQAANVLNAHIVEEGRGAEPGRHIALQPWLWRPAAELPASLSRRKWRRPCSGDPRYGGAPSRSNQIHHGGYRPAFPSEFRPGGRRKHRPYGGDALLHLPRRRYVRPARRRKDLLWQPRVSSP